MSEKLIGRVAGISVMIADDPAGTLPALVCVDDRTRKLSLDEVRDLILVLEAVGNMADVWRRTEVREDIRR